MSTSTQKTTDRIADKAVLPVAAYPSPPKRKKAQTPRRPRLSTIVKHALEDSVKETRQTQELLGQLLDWLEAEVKRREELLQRISTLVPLDHRMQTLVEEEKESLLSIGRLYPIIARMTLSITVLDRNLSETLERAKEAVAPPREHKAHNDGANTH